MKILKLCYKYLCHCGNTILPYHNKYCEEWDTELNGMLDNLTSAKLSSNLCRLSIENKGVWVANKFYCYGHLYTIDGIRIPRYKYKRPKFKTMLRLESLVEFLLTQEDCTWVKGE